MVFCVLTELLQHPIRYCIFGRIRDQARRCLHALEILEINILADGHSADTNSHAFELT